MLFLTYTKYLLYEHAVDTMQRIKALQGVPYRRMVWEDGLEGWPGKKA